MITFQGGGPFTAHDELDRSLLERTGARAVAVLPTADAMESPELLVEAAERWSERVGAASIDAVMVLQRADATADAGARLEAADAVYVVGDSPLHLRSAIKDTPVMAALTRHATDGLLVAAGASAAALCDPMTDPRGGAFTLGLGLVTEMALVTEAETWTDERLTRTRELAADVDGCLVIMPTGSALVADAGRWTPHGDVEVVGSLPPYGRGGPQVH